MIARTAAAKDLLWRAYADSGVTGGVFVGATLSPP